MKNSICQICFRQIAVDQHHIHRGINRRHSDTVGLCRRCHEAVTKEESWALYILDKMLEMRGIDGYSKVQA